jgi:3-hydroxyacyl-[acyl-carrier-protein] dehydratase
VLQVEAMAQLAGIVMLDPEDTAAKGLFFFGGIESCRFRKPVVPGDVLVRPALAWGNGRVERVI